MPTARKSWLASSLLAEVCWEGEGGIPAGLHQKANCAVTCKNPWENREKLLRVGNDSEGSEDSTACSFARMASAVMRLGVLLQSSSWHLPMWRLWLHLVPSCAQILLPMFSFE
jgi:hypothetical protein